MPADSHGSAEWGNPAEWAEVLRQPPTALLCGAFAFADVGWRPVRMPTWPTGHNVLVLGPPRSGKGARFFMPNLLAAPANPYPPNIIVMDPKSEFLATTWWYFQQHGYDVFNIDFTNPAQSTAFEPLFFSGGREALTDADIETLSLAMVPRTPEKEPFWQNMTRTICQVAIGAAAQAPDADEFSSRGPSLLDVMAIVGHLLRDRAIQQAVAKRLADNGWLAASWAMIANIAKSEGNLANNVSADLLARLAPLMRREILQVAAGYHETIPAPEWDLLLRHARRPWIIYIAASPAAYPPIRLALSSLLLVLRRIQASENHLQRPLWLLLDEFANIGQMPEMVEAATILPGLGVSLVMGLQAVGQLEHLYGKGDADALLDAAHLWLAFPGLGPESAKRVSDRAGQTTVYAQSLSESSHNLSASGRSLILPDEVSRLGKDQVLAHKSGYNAVILRSVAYYEQIDPAWQHAARIAHPDDPLIALSLADWRDALQQAGCILRPPPTDLKAHALQVLGAVEPDKLANPDQPTSIDDLDKLFQQGRKEPSA